MLRIAVCVKQVPAYDEGVMNPQTGLLRRSGLEAVMNIYDLPAIETALRIKERIGAQVDVYTMGLEGARQVLIEAFSMGADSGFLLSDTRFSGADVLATSYTLFQGMKSIGSYNLILCGSRSTDGDTSQVSGELAAWIGIPHFNWVTELNGVTKSSITITQSLNHGDAVLNVPFPCLLSVERGIFIPRIPNLKMRLLAGKKEAATINLDDLADKDEQHYGVCGSATRVEKIYSPPRNSRRTRNLNNDVDTAVEEILDLTASRIKG